MAHQTIITPEQKELLAKFEDAMQASTLEESYEMTVDIYLQAADLSPRQLPNLQVWLNDATEAGILTKRKVYHLGRWQYAYRIAEKE